ncbi:MAG TPA: hypothetical protein VGL61_00265 [Kofleriaceae bacterium]
MDARRRDAEETLEVGFRGRLTVEQHVRVDEACFSVKRAAPEALDMSIPI